MNEETDVQKQMEYKKQFQKKYETLKKKYE